MICRRCQSALHPEQAVERGRGPIRRIWLWACHACGERVDETILFHRALHKPESVAQRNDRLFRDMRVLYARIPISVLGGA